MKKRHNTRAYPMMADDQSRSLAVYFGISLIVHLIFIGSAVFMPESNPRPRLGQGAINVSLVSLPGPPAIAPAPAASPAPAPVPEPDAKKVVVPKKEVKKKPPAQIVETPPPKPPPVKPKPAKAVSVSPKPKQAKVKKSLKKKTQNRQKMIDQALSSVQKNVEKSQSDSVRQAIDRLKKKVAQSEGSPARTGQSAKSASAGAGGGGGRRTLEITDLYKIEVAFQVERHWALSQQLAGDSSRLQTKVVFRVLPNGEITDIKFTQRSGNSHLDESAYRAVVKANPVSPHPAEIRAAYVTVGLRFTPEGLKK